MSDEGISGRELSFVEEFLEEERKRREEQLKRVEEEKKAREEELER